MKVLNYTGLQNLWTNIKNYITAHTPTKTSDLTNDSNFVDTSNSAVSSGITSAKVTDYDTHIADTDIHVTTTDKNKWNNQTYVFRYSSTTLTPSSTNANSLLDNTDNLKVGDKVIDSNGVLFSITAIDTQNSTFTIGTALIDLAQDSDVVHRSGDETVDGNKTWTGANTFKQNITYERTNFYHQVANPTYILKDTELEKGSLATTHASYPGLWQDKNGNILGYVRFVEYSSGRQTAEIKVSNLIKNGALDPTGSEVNCAVDLELQPLGEKSLIPEQNNDINLGTSTNKWKTLNGVEPSSLSLPSGNVSNIIDISSYLSILDGSNVNTYVAPANGWISILMNNCSSVQGYITGLWGHQIIRPSVGSVRFLMPVLKNQTANILVLGGTIGSARFIPCQGNV